MTPEERDAVLWCAKVLRMIGEHADDAGVLFTEGGSRARFMMSLGRHLPQLDKLLARKGDG